ncbi:MAG: carbohydrate ABC transporter permease [Clostridiaceae bacterium]|jgi:putative aldouronate transport system permease protein|nr:carbohydrate ABC transporter permease [Clostridiaceae bacterium]
MEKRYILFNICNYTFLILIALTAIYPFIYMLTISLIPPGDYLNGGFVLFPERISLDAYRRIFENGSILLSFRSTLIITTGGVAINMFLTIICAYVMSKTDIKGYRFFINLIIFTMYFKGGLIPSYMLMRNLGLTDKYLSVMLTGAISTYNMLVLRSFFLNIPESLEEAAIMDGASEPFVLFKIIIPISLPAISTIGLFYAVGHWNSYYIPMIYLNSREKWPLQVLLREILFESTESLRTVGDIGDVQESAIGPQLKMATVMVTVLPIFCLYPFLQKYFVKGVLIGAVKA